MFSSSNSSNVIVIIIMCGIYKTDNDNPLSASHSM